MAHPAVQATPAAPSAPRIDLCGLIRDAFAGTNRLGGAPFAPFRSGPDAYAAIKRAVETHVGRPMAYPDAAALAVEVGMEWNRRAARIRQDDEDRATSALPSALPRAMATAEILREHEDGAARVLAEAAAVGPSPATAAVPFFQLVEQLRNRDRCPRCRKTRVLLELATAGVPVRRERPDPLYHCACAPLGPAAPRAARVARTGRDARLPFGVLVAEAEAEAERGVTCPACGEVVAYDDFDARAKTCAACEHQRQIASGEAARAWAWGRDE